MSSAPEAQGNFVKNACDLFYIWNLCSFVNSGCVSDWYFMRSAQYSRKVATLTAVASRNFSANAKISSVIGKSGIPFIVFIRRSSHTTNPCSCSRARASWSGQEVLPRQEIPFSNAMTSSTLRPMTSLATPLVLPGQPPTNSHFVTTPSTTS